MSVAEYGTDELVRVVEAVEQDVGLVLIQVIAVEPPGAYRDGERADATSAADVVLSVSDDDDVAPVERSSGVLARTCHGDRRQLIAVFVVAAEGAEREVMIQADRFKLQVSERLEISGEERELNVVTQRELFDQLLYTTEQFGRFRTYGLPHQLGVGFEPFLHKPIQRGAVEATRREHFADDLWIGLS